MSFLKTFFFRAVCIAGLFVGACFCVNVSAQVPFTISVVPSGITSAPAIHSFAFAELNGKWIFIGGRTNGLHGFLPPFAFPLSGVNDSVFVVDPVLNQRWSASTSVLTDSIREAVCSTNMEFYQNDTMLYMVGGYGWKNSVSNFVTFPKLTAINLNGFVNAVQNALPIDPYFRQMNDSVLAVTGGHLDKIGSQYQLVFGHRFDGTYNVNEFSPSFVQRYTNEVRRFEISDDGLNLSLQNFTALRDTDNFHRRDYNLVPQIFLDGSFGLTAFSGVFRYHLLRPFTESIDVKASTAAVVPGFNQLYAHYDCATMPLYDSANNVMHSVFFGGMSMNYFDTASQTLVYDTLVPFVNTISRVQRDASGVLTEYRLQNHLPGFVGTDAIFIPAKNISLKNGSIILYDALDTVTTVGYIAGGIRSPDYNISASGAEVSSASDAVYAVVITKEYPALADEKVEPAADDFMLYPNPVSDGFQMQFILRKSSVTQIALYSMDGKKVMTLKNETLEKGPHRIDFTTSGLAAGTYVCRVQIEGKRIAQKVVVKGK